MDKFTFKMRLQELWYWHIKRNTRKFIPWVARKLPNKVKYYVVIDGMVQAAGDDLAPDQIRGMEILDVWSPRKDVRTHG